MPLLTDLSLGSLASSKNTDEKLDSLVRQLNEWARMLSNEKETTVQHGEDGSVRIVQGVQYDAENNVTFVGTLYYDADGVPRILIGLHPLDQHAGIWISSEGENVISLLVA